MNLRKCLTAVRTLMPLGERQARRLGPCRSVSQCGLAPRLVGKFIINPVRSGGRDLGCQRG
jgi:hypothetical protein